MRTLLFGLLVLLALGSAAEAQVWVDSYTRSDGTQVRGHWRSQQNGTATDNYSFPGNVNPNTGRISPGNPYTKDSDRDGTPDISDPTPYGRRSGPRGSRSLGGRY